MARQFLILFSNVVWLRYINSQNVERIDACNNLNCDISSNETVCGVRKEMTTMQLKLFENECALLKYGCSVDNKDAYGLISMEYCNLSDIVNTDPITSKKEIEFQNLPPAKLGNNRNNCEVNCTDLDEAVCGIRQDGEGYRVKLFENKCDLIKYNCNTTSLFSQTDMFICKGTFEAPDNSTSKANIEVQKIVEGSKKIIVIDGSMLGQTTNPNETIENFFAATHVLDLPIKEVGDEFRTRRMILKNAGPVKVFTPWVVIPKKILTDFYHTPTLSTCYHKCPTQCPDTYSPVCGVPGILAREPSIMFQNHCYMDVAQCKMYWENKSSTAISSCWLLIDSIFMETAGKRADDPPDAYIESSFLFCLGDQLNGMYRFLPLVKTLQHMGRLRSKGRFHYRLKNMRFFNNYAYREPKLMG